MLPDFIVRLSFAMRLDLRWNALVPARHWRPTATQEVLLRAALEDGDRAREAWHQWLAAVDGGAIGRGSERILPLAFTNLRDAGVDPLPPSLCDAASTTWIANQLLFAQMARLISQLRDADIDVIVLKGAALAQLAYRDPALRPMSDMDVLVRADQVFAAMRILNASGWQSEYGNPERFVPYSHALTFRGPDGGVCDLHWRALWNGAVVDDESFWRRRIRFDVNGVPAAALCPADQLLHVCVHATSWSETPAQWVADAVLLIRTSGRDVDWSQLVQEAIRRRVVLPVRETLRYLGDAFGCSVPEHALRKLEASAISQVDRVAYYCRSDKRVALRYVPQLLYWFRSWRHAGPPQSARAMEFVDYVIARSRGKSKNLSGGAITPEA